MGLGALVAAMPVSANGDDPRTPHFVDATAVSGLSHTFGGGPEFVVGGGGAAFDCNGDGLPEVALAGGDAPLTIWRNRSLPGGAVTLQPVEDLPEVRRATGVYPLDIDGDGALDLFVLRFGQNQVLRGLGACRFELAEGLGLPMAEDWTTAFAATWTDAGAPLLAIGNYVPRDRPLQASGNCEPSYLVPPAEVGFDAPISLGPGACTLSALFLDWSGTGRIDLRFANDREYYDRGQSEQLWRLTEEGPVAYTRDDGWDAPQLWGMGLAARDITGDDLPEVAVTSMADNRLERLRAEAGGQPRFDDVARAMGATAHMPHVGPDLRPSTAWHTEFADFNNDAQADLLIVKGNVDAMPRMANFDPDSLLLGDGTRFHERSFEAGIAVDSQGRGAVVADLNGDGWLDLITVNRNQPVRLWQQVHGAGAWIAIDPRQAGANAFAVGALVEVKAAGIRQTQVRRVGGGHAGGTLLPLHFGLAEAEEADVRILWPDGTSGEWQTLAAGEAHLIERRME
ncbi:MAG: CRTAC1 family protein [Pseudomonadota bacterium]